MSMNPQEVAALLRMAQSGSQMAGANQAGGALGDANSALGIYSGLASGTPQGDLSAASKAAKLYGNLAGNPAVSQAGNMLGGALGVYGGIKQGGVAGDTQAALGAAQLGSQAAGMAGATGLSTALGAAGPIGLALAPALYGMSTPAVQLTGQYYNRLNDTLNQGPGAYYNQDNPTQYGNYYGTVLGMAGSNDPEEEYMLAQHGVQPGLPVATSNLQPWQVAQELGVPQQDMGPTTRPNGKHATGGAVKTHFDDGGDVSLDYYTPTDDNGIPYSWQNPTLTDFGSPSSDPYSSLGQSGLLNSNVVNQQNDPYAYNSATSGSIASQAGGLGGLSSLLSNPALLGALLGGGIGLAGALGSNNGQQTMLANYNPTPPQMFQGSGPSASNMYGNFSSQPRQRLNPTNINYATAGQNPTPGGNLFYSPTGGGPTAAPSQQSPLQQYGAQMPQQQQSMQPNQLSAQQLIAMLSNPQQQQHIPPSSLWARGGDVHDQPPMGPLARHMLPATHGGPAYIQGEGDGTSDDIDAKLSNGEYVMDAGTVAMLGNGSNEAGARKLDELRENLRRHAGKQLVQGKQFMKAKKPQAYMARGGHVSTGTESVDYFSNWRE